MRRALLGLLALPAPAAACSDVIEFDFDIPVDDCPDTDLSCLPPSLTLNVLDSYSDVESTPSYVARGGQVEVSAQGGIGHTTFKVTGGGVVARSAGGVVIRADAAAVGVDVHAGEARDSLWFYAFPVERVRLVPMEQAFLFAAGPVDFALARGAELDVVVRLEGGGQPRLVDRTLIATGDAGVAQLAWDSIHLSPDPDADSIAMALEAESAAADIEVDVAEPTIDAIRPVAGPQLSDPTRPISLTGSFSARICFFGLAGGRPVAGLVWRFEGPGITPHPEGCVEAHRDRASNLSVSAGGLTREFELRFADSTYPVIDPAWTGDSQRASP
jgi:hypothetical protein